MTIISASDLTQIRTQPHSSRLMMSIYKPPTVLSGRIDIVGITRGATTFSYTLLSGSYLNCASGMTMYVGTTVGASDKGSIRVKDVTATTITVAENAHIDWATGLYLTIVDYVEIWPIHPRYVQVGETVTFFKDYDISYVNQNTVLGTFTCMGPHHAACLGPGDTVNVYYSASGSASVRGDSLTYAWTFEGGTPSSYSGITPGNVAYTVPGHYTTKLVITNSSGGTDTSYRYVSIYDQSYQGTNHPIRQWGMTSMAGSRAEGGYTVSVWCRENVADVVDGALVVLFSDDYYGSNHVSIGGNALNRPGVFFVGYIQRGSVEYNYQDDRVEFEIVSPTLMMKDMETYAIQTNRSGSPSTWYEVLDQDGKRALYSYLRWHSTALMVADFRYLIDDKNIYSFQSDRTSLYDAVQSFVKNTFVADFYCDRQGAMYCETSPAAIDDAENVYSTCQLVDKHDWMGSLGIEEVITEPLAYLEMGGTHNVSASVEDEVPYLSGAPGIVAGYRGRSDQRQGLALDSQEELNTLVGNVFAYENARFPMVTLNMTGNYRHFDIGPVELIRLVVSSADNDRGLSWNGKAFHITDMSWTYNSSNEFLYPNVTLHEITQGIPGETIVIPPEPPDGNGNTPNTNPPNTPTVPVPPNITGSTVGLHLTQIEVFGSPKWLYPLNDATLNCSSAGVINGTKHYLFSTFPDAQNIGQIVNNGSFYWIFRRTPTHIDVHYTSKDVSYGAVARLNSPLDYDGGLPIFPQHCWISDNVEAIIWRKNDGFYYCTKIDKTGDVPVVTNLFYTSITMNGKATIQPDFLIPISSGGVVRYLMAGISGAKNEVGGAEYFLLTYDLQNFTLDSQSFESLDTGNSYSLGCYVSPQVVNGWLVMFLEEQREDETLGMTHGILIAYKPFTNTLREKVFTRSGLGNIWAISSGLEVSTNKVWFGVDYLTSATSKNLIWVYPDADIPSVEPWYTDEGDSMVTSSINEMIFSPDALYGLNDSNEVVEINNLGTNLRTISDYDVTKSARALARLFDNVQNRVWMLVENELRGYQLGTSDTRIIDISGGGFSNPEIVLHGCGVELVHNAFVIQTTFATDPNLQVWLVYA